MEAFVGVRREWEEITRKNLTFKYSLGSFVRVESPEPMQNHMLSMVNGHRK